VRGLNNIILSYFLVYKLQQRSKLLENFVSLSEVPGSHGGEYEDDPEGCDLRFCSVLAARWTAERDSSDDKGSKYLWNVGKLPPGCAVLTFICLKSRLCKRHVRYTHNCSTTNTVRTQQYLGVSQAARGRFLPSRPGLISGLLQEKFVSNEVELDYAGPCQLLRI
jgi:hypothetical protein